MGVYMYCNGVTDVVALKRTGRVWTASGRDVRGPLTPDLLLYISYTLS
jgi:hypothetical protein